ncbi:MAG TPA: hypothetical protein DCQ98_02980 [Planctomycetaceae bacterium]|nr:hypothetical protein [Planctomycetaceae bacterium]HRF01401.1 hypothetical protein [Pirellulaceae bacterium]
MIGKLLIGGVVLIVLALEIGVALMLTPSPKEVADQVRSQIEAETKTESSDTDLVPDADSGPQIEVELGEFNITVHQQASESSYTIACKVIGTVAEKDKDEVTALKEKNQARLRERIMIEFRNADIQDLTDSELGLIKRRILEKTNALFGKPLLTSVLLPDFNYYQQ